MFSAQLLYISLGILSIKSNLISPSSWGSDWGDKGFVKFSRSRVNMCQLTSRVMYTVVIGRDRGEHDQPDFIPGIGYFPWLLSMVTLHGYFPWLLSMVTLSMVTFHGYFPWLLSMVTFHGYFPWLLSMVTLSMVTFHGYFPSLFFGSFS